MSASYRMPRVFLPGLRIAMAGGGDDANVSFYAVSQAVEAGEPA